MKYNYLSLGLLALSARAFGHMDVETATPATPLHITRKPITTTVEAIPSYFPRTNLMAKTVM